VSRRVCCFHFLHVEVTAPGHSGTPPSVLALGCREELTLIRRPFLVSLDSLQVVWCTKACFVSACHSPIKSRNTEAVAVGLKLRMKGHVCYCLNDLGNCF
jgi:hypothetical protein